MQQTSKSETALYIRGDKGARFPIQQSEKAANWADIYADYGFTGTDCQCRPEPNRLLADCRAGCVKRVVVKSTTQLARRTVDLLAILQEFQSLGVVVEFEKERFSTDSPMGKKMLDVLCVMNEHRR